MNRRTFIGALMGAAAAIGLAPLVKASSFLRPTSERAPRLPRTLRVPSQYATLSEAVKACRNGDTIMVDPGHSETLRQTITLDKAGVSIVGGNYRRGMFDDRPMFHFQGENISLRNAVLLNT